MRSSDGQPLGGVRLIFRHTVTGNEIAAISNGEGVFLVRDLAPGAYIVRAALDGFEPYSGDLLPSASVVDFEFAMHPISAELRQRRFRRITSDRM